MGIDYRDENFRCVLFIYFFMNSGHAASARAARVFVLNIVHFVKNKICSGIMGSQFVYRHRFRVYGETLY